MYHIAADLSRGINVGTADASSGVDTSAPDGVGEPTINVWTRNLFGTTNPVGLSK